MPVPGETALIAFGVLPRRGWPCFLFWNAIGGIVWGTGFVLLGYAAGASYHEVEHQVGRGVAIALAVVAVAALVAWRLRARARERGLPATD